MSVWDLLQSSRQDVLAGADFRLPDAWPEAAEWGRWLLLRGLPGPADDDECFIATSSRPRVKRSLVFLRRFPRHRLPHPWVREAWRPRRLRARGLDRVHRGPFPQASELPLPGKYGSLVGGEGMMPGALERVTDLGKHDHVPYVASPWIAGVTIGQVLPRTTAPVRLAVFLAASQALDQLHAAGLAHGGGLRHSRVRLCLGHRHSPLQLAWSYPLRACADGTLRPVESTSLHAIHEDRRRLAASCLLDEAGYRIAKALLDEGSPQALQVLHDQLLEQLPPAVSPNVLRRYLLGYADALECEHHLADLVSSDALRSVWRLARRRWADARVAGGGG